MFKIPRVALHLALAHNWNSFWVSSARSLFLWDLVENEGKGWDLIFKMIWDTCLAISNRWIPPKGEPHGAASDVSPVFSMAWYGEIQVQGVFLGLMDLLLDIFGTCTSSLWKSSFSDSMGITFRFYLTFRSVQFVFRIVCISIRFIQVNVKLMHVRFTREKGAGVGVTRLGVSPRACAPSYRSRGREVWVGSSGSCCY